MTQHMNGKLIGSAKIGEPTAPATESMSEVDKTKMSLTVLENLFHAVNAAQFQPRYFSAVTNGMGYIAQWHQKLFETLPVEEQEKAKAKKAETFKPEII